MSPHQASPLLSFRKRGACDVTDDVLVHDELRGRPGADWSGMASGRYSNEGRWLGGVVRRSNAVAMVSSGLIKRILQ